MPSLLITSLLWAFSFGLIKHHLAGVDPRFVAFARLALAALLFLPWLRFQRIQAKLVLQLCLIGAIQFGLMYLLYLQAFQFLQAYQVALLTIVTPIWVCLSEDLLRRTFSWRPIWAAGLAIVGAAVVLGGRGFGRAAFGGILLLQASNACFALGQVLYRRMRQRGPAFAETSMFGWLYLGAVAVTFPMAFTSMPAAVGRLNWHEFWVLSYLGLVASGLGFFLWNQGAARVSASVLAVLNNAKTPLGLLVSLLWFGESVQLVRLAIGSTIVVFATLYAQRTSPAN
jgi:drug/metabolite transporter (DMT)-like permease